MALVDEYDAKKETAAVIEKALKGRGFVLFAGVLTEKKDEDGNSIVEFQYIRHHFPFEDLPKATTAFRDQCYKDAVSMFDRK